MDMSHAVTLTLPDRLYEPVQRIAQATNQPLEAVLLTALQASLPPLEGLSADIANELAELEVLDDEALWGVMFEQVPEDEQEEIEDLLHRNQAGTSSEADRDQLIVLQHRADRVMLRKARAAVLRRFRGQRVPTLAEMRVETPPAG
jgi:predicted transcriptional regulator